MAKIKFKRCAETDFTESKLPHNRKEVFFDCFKLRWREFLKLGAIILLSMLPILLICVVRDNLIADAIQNTDSLKSAEFVLLLSDVLCIPMYLLSSVAFSGAFRVIKNIAWGDIVFFSSDFKDGIRLNFKVFSPVFLLVGTGIFFVDFAMLHSNAEILKGIPLGLSAFLLMPIAILVIVQGTIYSLSFFGALKNAVYLFLRSPISSAIASILTLSPSLFIVVSNTVVKHVILALYFMIIFPYVCLGVFLFGCTVLDKHYNPIYHTEIIGKGIAPISEDFADDDEDVNSTDDD